MFSLPQNEQRQTKFASPLEPEIAFFSCSSPASIAGVRAGKRARTVGSTLTQFLCSSWHLVHLS